MPDEFYRLQADLLDKTCKPQDPSVAVFVDRDLDCHGRLAEEHKQSAWFLFFGTNRAAPLLSLPLSDLIDQGFFTPLLVVELLPPGTKAEDLKQAVRDAKTPYTKWELYERVLRVPYYVLYNRNATCFRVFNLVNTNYKEQQSGPGRDFSLRDIQLSLRLWQGKYEGIDAQWLRWYDREELILTSLEQTERALRRLDFWASATVIFIFVLFILTLVVIFIPPPLKVFGGDC